MPKVGTQEALTSSCRPECVGKYLLKSGLEFIPGVKIFGLKRISKMMSLTEPTSLHAARTASVDRESPEKKERKIVLNKMLGINYNLDSRHSNTKNTSYVLLRILQSLHFHPTSP